MMNLTEISEYLQQGRAKEVRALVQQALEEQVSPQDILNEGMLAGMQIIGIKFKKNEVFVPEVLIAARAMNAGLEVLRPVLINSGVKPIGKAIICTVAGDLHDIGKNLVKMMFEGQGIECLDLGVDVKTSTIIEKVEEYQPDLVCLSALLATTMMEQKEVIEALIKAGLREQVKVLVGGAPVTQAFAEEIGADGYAMDAASAAELAKEILLK
ncbi:MAG TPA: corrinoid protein [Bacilli bacterium]|nr:cobalamin-binding protein [Acholeplasmataceae bacterium]HNZ78032.1 corrinoid protein [Bacilli bacterium]HOD61254.1 corrinoid protein [Bacilli bacterium]HOE06692.1 corrinoid protein [Bacilli bacterium]HOH61880.1 corrinoid protein [Bacilli bacterium]